MGDALRKGNEESVDVMEQLTFSVIDEACLAAMRNRILAAWPLAGYDNGYHKANSLDKNLGVRSLLDCDDIKALETYLVHVGRKKDG